MDLQKSLEFFNPSEMVKAPISIIGVGAVGSYIATGLARLGCSNIHLYDFDIVEPKNIVNQMFTEEDVEMPKVEAVERMLRRINSHIEVKTHPEGLKAPYRVEGYVFLCVDNIDVRREIVKANQYNMECKCFFDCRMALTSGQHYFCDARIHEQVKELLETMNFSHEEAKAAMPTTACGTELGVGYVVQGLTSLAIMNFVKYCLNDKPFRTVFADFSTGAFDCFN